MQAYRADPKTGLVMLLMTPSAIRITRTLVYRGIKPEDLDDAQVKETIRGWELLDETFWTVPKKGG